MELQVKKSDKTSNKNDDVTGDIAQLHRHLTGKVKGHEFNSQYPQPPKKTI